MAWDTQYNIDDTSSSRRISEIKLNVPKGWSPVLRPFIVDRGDSVSVYLEVVDFIGGDGDKPVDLTLQRYFLGADGYVSDYNTAVDLGLAFMSVLDRRELIGKSTFTLSIIGDETKSLEITYKDFNGENPVTLTVPIYTTDANDGTYPVSFSYLRTYIEQAITARIYAGDISSVGPSMNSYAVSPYSVKQYVDNRITQYPRVNTIVLTKEEINRIKQVSASDSNPYVFFVIKDGRTGGRVTTTCSQITDTSCCGDCYPFSYGTSERGEEPGLTGCLCEPGIAGQHAQCTLTVSSVGTVGNQFTLQIDNKFSTYIVQAGDTPLEVVQGLLNNFGAENSCGGDNPCSQVGDIAFDGVTASVVMEATSVWEEANLWPLHLDTGDGIGSISRTRDAITPQPATYTGVEGHLIAWTGAQFWDLGKLFAGAMVPNVNGAHRYRFYGPYTLVVPDEHQYIVFNTLESENPIYVEGTGMLVVIDQPM